MPLGDAVGLFIGKVDNNVFAVAEIVIKDGKYADRGKYSPFDITDPDNSHGTKHWDFTDFRGVYEEWAIMCSADEMNARDDVKTTYKYEFSEDFTIYLALLEEQNTTKEVTEWRVLIKQLTGTAACSVPVLVELHFS